MSDDETLEQFTLRIGEEQLLKSRKKQQPSIEISNKHYKDLIKDSWALSLLRHYEDVLNALDQLEIDFYDDEVKDV